jgi:hypothetical protein
VLIAELVEKLKTEVAGGICRKMIHAGIKTNLLLGAGMHNFIHTNFIPLTKRFIKLLLPAASCIQGLTKPTLVQQDKLFYSQTV